MKKFSFLYAYENNTLLNLLLKFVCTGDDMTKLKEVLKKTDVNEMCTRSKTKTRRSFYKQKNLTTFAASIKKTYGLQSCSFAGTSL